MNRERWKDLFEIVGVVAIVASLIFLTLEIRTNTETNQIAIFQNYSANWFEMHSQVAGNRDLAALVEKALSGAELDKELKHDNSGATYGNESHSRTSCCVSMTRI